MDTTFRIVTLASTGIAKWKGVIQWKGVVPNESWCMIARSIQEGHLALVRVEARPFGLWHSVITGILPVWREPRYAWKVSMSRCDTQRCPFLFFLTIVFNL